MLHAAVVQRYHGDSRSHVHRVDVVAIDKWVEAGRHRREAVSPMPRLLVRCNSLEVRDWLRTHAHASQRLPPTHHDIVTAAFPSAGSNV